MPEFSGFYPRSHLLCYIVPCGHGETMPILAGIVLVKTLAPTPLLQTQTNAASNPANPGGKVMAAVKLIVEKQKGQI